MLTYAALLSFIHELEQLNREEHESDAYVDEKLHNLKLALAGIVGVTADGYGEGSFIAAEKAIAGLMHYDFLAE